MKTRLSGLARWFNGLMKGKDKKNDGTSVDAGITLNEAERIARAEAESAERKSIVDGLNAETSGPNHQLLQNLEEFSGKRVSLMQLRTADGINYGQVNQANPVIVAMNKLAQEQGKYVVVTAPDNVVVGDDDKRIVMEGGETPSGHHVIVKKGPKFG